jgi:hypothetical protein
MWEYVRQFIHGLSLPFHIASALRTDARAWRRYLAVALLQSVAILAVGYVFKDSASEAVSTPRTEAERRELEAAREEAGRRVTEIVLNGIKLEVREAGPEFEEAVAREVRENLPPVPAPAAEESSGTPAESPRAVVKLIVDELQLWLALFATLQIIQWIVIALSRDYHDAISRDASLLTAIEPEDGPRTPSIRVDLKWMGKKFQRRVRAFLILLTGIPVFIMFTAPFRLMNELVPVLFSLWSVYWLLVFTASKTARAWKDTSGRSPWFLRGWTWLTTKVPGFRWGFLQAYGRFWDKRTREVFSPAVEFEKQPWAFAGLSVIRVLAILPVVKCFLRPLIPVAAAHLMRAQQASAPPAPTEQPAPLAQPTAPTSNAA